MTTVELGEGVEWTGMDDTVCNVETNETYKDVVLAAINYIIHADEHISVSGGTESELKYFAGMTAEGEEIYNTTTLNTAKYNSQLRLEVADGYELDCSQFGADAKLVSLGNGVYTLYVTENGNLIFTATIVKAEAATTAKKSKTLAQRIVDGEFGDVLTDVEDNEIEFTAAQKNGEMTLTYTDEDACHLHVNAALAKALVANGAEKLTVKMGENAFTYMSEDIKAVLEEEQEDGEIDEMLAEINDDEEEPTAIAYSVTDEEKTDISETLVVEIVSNEQEA